MGDLLDTVFLYMLNSALSQDSGDTRQENHQESNEMAARELTSPENSFETCAWDVKSPHHTYGSMSDADLKINNELSHLLYLGTRVASALLEKETISGACIGSSME
mmetsp:Transcript_5572/g.8538  ORF Transcript_5572/g.8538 Transcript_5572/m.8538 type:complete len:106 (+) Transcript_5572:176-493(+)|eukprot:CAMPEP_0195295130 /NCGR_PEP_ID=MMETSP0707-20130614/16665_1 /TAXON_ID=33640 /ORGANISM="Asterionellopsis glacialis, Strain CCMP134" /LENGTH=105 /DNA_ID=CAMNT_0040356279 /DNA_START=132 /DNA_END=449 /DNA_ORIENTATION=+